MFSARATAKILARQQDACTLVARLVQHEVGIGLACTLRHTGFALVQIAPFVEQVGAKACAPDRLEKLLGNDGVGINVFAIERRNQALVNGECLHGDGAKDERAPRPLRRQEALTITGRLFQWPGRWP